MASQVYFGNATKQLWIKSPLSGMSASVEGWATETTMLNGRAYIRRSKAGHRKFSPSWVGPANSSSLSESLTTIKDFADGLYGDGPFFWVDPYAAKTNMMPPHWAAPMLTEQDWPNLAPGIAPTFSTTSAAQGYPIKYATYETTAGYESSNKLTIIIPSGYKLAFGWHGPSGDADQGVRILPYKRSTGLADTALNPNRITTGAVTRTNTNISGTTYSHVEIFIATTNASTLNISAMIAQVIPESQSVPNGEFISGRGTTGLEFATSPQIEYYSANINDGQIGMSVDWVEV